jgi:hypothetical protein
VYIEKAFAHRDQFLAAVDRVASSLPPEVVQVFATLGTDWNGESAVFFKVILKDNAIPQSELIDFTQQITWTLIQELSPLEDWGVPPYFRFLTETEYAWVKQVEPAWA